MDPLSLKDLIWVILPALVGLLTYLYREIKADITMIKQEVQSKTSEPQVRQIVADKVDPIKEDLQEIKKTLDKIQDHLMKS